ncbi:MAG TPA: amidase [Actinomycetota bacterium]|nr:amidase [Actinomycetota bacterium]
MRRGAGPGSPDRPAAAAEMARAVAAGETSPVELVAAALARLERWEPVTNAFSLVRAEEALDLARAAERALSDGVTLGPLHGVPVAVKDLFDVRGWETTGCCRAYEGNVARTDAALVTRLRSAGAIVVGKTNQHELACGATNVVSACGPTRNPWDPTRITGGSSGGSGAAVATGVVPIALGTDTGGSIRIPSSLCGCLGLKPTTGRLPAEGMMPLAPSLDCPGPMAATAEDLALAWTVLSGRPPDVREPGAPARVGVLGGWFGRATADQLAAVRAAVEALAAGGSDVVELPGEGIEDVVERWRAVAWAEFADHHGSLLERPELLGERTAAALRFGVERTPEQRADAAADAARIRRWFLERLAGIDVLLTPTTPFPAPPADADAVEVGPGVEVDVHRGGPAWFTEPVNLSRLPAVAVPAGRSGEGLPLSVQLIGPEDGEPLLLAWARFLEDAGDRFRAGRPDPRSAEG